MNLVTVNFLECPTLPSSGYKVLWRVLGSGDPYADAGNFFTSPAVFSDEVNPAGTNYEGLLIPEGHNTDCDPVPWNTFVPASGSSVPPDDNSSCGAFLSQSTAALTYVALPRITLHVAGQAHVQVLYNAYDRPNRFTIYDNGLVATTSGWVGYGPYPGPWGMSLNVFPSGSLTFNPIAGHLYELLVEVGPAGPPPYNISDDWDAQVFCS